MQITTNLVGRRCVITGSAEQFLNQRDFYMQPDANWDAAMSVFRGRTERARRGHGRHRQNGGVTCSRFLSGMCRCSGCSKSMAYAT